MVMIPVVFEGATIGRIDIDAQAPEPPYDHCFTTPDGGSVHLTAIFDQPLNPAYYVAYTKRAIDRLKEAGWLK